ncbi:ABC transporter ATP-binding protein/permease [Candidatus Pelagibacter ubique]|nr:ABC transporter ATP-binding protein/permease [Candidatus Pelagibacter ubique]
MALLDMIGVASILPFMTVLVNPSIIETNMYLNNIFQFSKKFGIETDQEFLFFLGIFVFILLFISLAFKSLTIYFQIRFVQMREYSIGKRLVEGYLHQPYSWFLNRNSSDLGKTILSEVQQFISNGISPILELISKGTVAIAITTLLIIVEPKIALIAGFSLAGIYLAIFYFFRRYLNLIGSKRLKNNQLRFRSVSEAFGAIKEIKVNGLEQTYINWFSNSAQNYAQTQSTVRILAQLPRFILEGIAFGGILLLMLYLISKTGNFNEAIPIISLYVFAGYRLMPSLQVAYASLAQLTFIGPSLDKLNNDLKNLKPFDENQEKNTFIFHDVIKLKNIYFKYPNTSRSALNDVSLNIPAKSTVGLIGTTGSGKTTLADIILGLFESQKGILEVDGVTITKKNIRSWQKIIGYVPQHIFLADTSIEQNIAFGVDAINIKKEIIEKVSKIANLHDFVINELPDQYQTTIGERGVKLSGGQRQRIGIARALYHNPKLLILDEATSALDNQTEKAVMEAVNSLRKNITIIIVAHRLNTVKNCDYIIKLEQGQVVGLGKYNDIIYDRM